MISGPLASSLICLTSMEMGNAWARAMWVVCAVGALDVDLLLLDAGAQEAPGGAHEVAGVAAALEAHQVRAEQAVDDGAAPRQLGEDFRRRERDVVEEPDLQVRPGLAEHLRDELELVVLHPDGGAWAALPMTASANRRLTRR